MRYALFAALLLTAACKETTEPPRPDPMPGTYPLRSIDGNAPPQVIQQDTSGRLSIVYGVVVLKEDKTFLDSTDVQFVTSTGQVATQSEVAHGTWRVSNDTLFLLPAGSTSYYMLVTVNGVELSQDFVLDPALPPVILLYRK